MTDGRNPTYPTNHEPGTEYADGLTIREHYAGIILAGLVAKYPMINNTEDKAIVCQVAVELSDELIKQLNK